MTPILWSFRRCPYAMRARMALISARVEVELREIKLKEKPDAFLIASASGTVPCLQTENGVLDESLDIMQWALAQNDPEQFLAMSEGGFELIARNDGPFKAALDRTKYATRYPGSDREAERAKASAFLNELEQLLQENRFLMGDHATLADIAIFPFVRQFAHIDRSWFDAQPWPKLITWLDGWLHSPAFAHAMKKYPLWSDAA